jgi:protein SCO1/2
MKMKIKFTLALAAFAAVALFRGAEPKKSACCDAGATDAKAATEKSCCTGEQSTAPLSTRSLYQLEATWTNDAGQPAQLAALRGRPVVLAMFFANCEYACPIIVDAMKRLGASLPADVRAKAQFVLVSFDTARDTPAALKAYRERMELGEAWTLLRGDAANVQELAMLLGVKFKQDARGQFSHSNLITVLNPEGEIAHQRAGLMGDVSEAAKAVVLAAK